MARPHKKRKTQPSPNPNTKAGPGPRPPKSMVIRMGAGEIGTSISQLVQDFRHVMEPDTASRLKERKANKLKDYTAMAGPLGVTHLFLFSRSKSGNIHLRIALTPRGPTLSFRIDKYALCKDIAKSQKQPRGGGKEHQTAPLLVMNNFTTPTSDPNTKDHITKQLESLTTTVFQSMFPPISPQSTPLSSIRRILLLNRELRADTDTYTYSLRHYTITTRATGISKRVRRIDPNLQQHKKKSRAALPNLGKLEDAADYLLDPTAAGYTSASETELDTDAEVEVLETPATKVLSRKQRDKLYAQRQQKAEQTNGSAEGTNGTSKPRPGPKGNIEKRAVKLHELGPRITLRLVKVEEGICEGKVMWNNYVSKSKAEEKELDEKWEVRRKEKEERRRIQRKNVERKREAKKNAKANSGQNGEEGEEDDSEEMDSEEVEEMLEDEMNGANNDSDEDDEVNGGMVVGVEAANAEADEDGSDEDVET